jgi:preprotein translocase subunit Sss1
MEAMVESAAAQWKQFGKESTAFVKKCDKPTNENMVGE